MPKVGQAIVPQCKASLPRKLFVDSKPSTNGHTLNGDGAHEVEDAFALSASDPQPKSGSLLARYGTPLREAAERHAATPVVGLQSPKPDKLSAKCGEKLGRPVADVGQSEEQERQYRAALSLSIIKNSDAATSEATSETSTQDTPSPDFLADFRAIGKILTFLQHDTPQRRELLEATDMAEGDISVRMCTALGEDFIAFADEIQASEEFAWCKRPDAHREGSPLAAGVVTRRLSEVQARDVEWLWPQRFPIGYLSLVNGDPDLGKTWLILDTLARITTGRGFPDGAPNPFAANSAYSARREVLWVSAEDADEDVVKPRFIKLGGDTSRLHSVVCVVKSEKKKLKQQSLDLTEHLDMLDKWLEAHPLVVAIALDPLAAFVGKTDTHRNSDVRGVLSPLAKLAEQHRVALIGNNHLNKSDGNNAMYRGMGSIAFVAAARSSWLVTPDPEQPKDRRLFTRVKGNLNSEDIAGLAYRVGQHVGGLLWEEGSIDNTANDALASVQADRDTHAPAKAEAKRWLRDLLKEGPVAASEVWERVEADGLCEKTVKVAKRELGVRTDKSGGSGAGWFWTLPK